ncbi:MAG: YbbR-like domain-containing protein [Bacteroidetes bacterium]|jgi:YbbR domain-containing protein|nr:YbbR-like domain-containing protein [Bacteroidota bacterium]
MNSSNAITRIRRLLLGKKVGTFLICLGIASLLWVVHALNRNYTYTLKVPVKFLNLPSNKLIVGELPEKLDVEIKTSGLKLLFISLKKNYNEVIVDFNLMKNNAKSQAYSINNVYFNLKNSINFDVELIKIRPDTLFFSINKSNSKLLPVKANLKVNCLPGYSIISKPTITPAYVTVSGDSISLQKMDTVYTYFLNLKDVHQNFTSPVQLKKPYTSINYNVKDVQLSFNVDKLIESSIKIPVQIMNNTGNETIKLLPNFITIKYLVAMKDYENINENSFKAVVNFEHIKEKQKNLQVEIIRTPSEVKIIKTTPSTISYLIYK